jgi:Cu2+-exporting ATPase
VTRDCFHCQEPLPADIDIRAAIGGQEQSFCCHGCRAVAELIAGAGLDDYYRFRSSPAASLSATTAPTPDEWCAYDQSALLDQLTTVNADGTRSATLALDNIGCAACGWLIDRMLKREADVCAVNVNVATARVHIRWRDSLPFSALLHRIARLGYRPHPLDFDSIGSAAKDAKTYAALACCAQRR